MITRAITGAVFVLIVISSLLFGPWSMELLFLIFAVIGLRECYHLINTQPAVIPRYTGGYFIGIVLYILVCGIAMDTVPSTWLLGLVPLIVLMFCFELFYREKFSLTHLGATLVGWVYVVVPFAMINSLAFVSGQYQYHLPLGFFLLLWTNDTGAYLVGKFFGKHKLFEKVSPNKTWEGLAGGILLAFAVAWLLSNSMPVVSLNSWLIMAAIISVFANLGDLFESLVKRGVGVKDSGKIIPGHGGVLDRFDGLFMSLPLVLFYLKIFVFK